MDKRKRLVIAFGIGLIINTFVICLHFGLNLTNLTADHTLMFIINQGVIMFVTNDMLKE